VMVNLNFGIHRYNNSQEQQWTAFKMVFFTSIIIVIILYYLQSDGLVYVTIVALTAELVNIFMAHTLSKSIEKRLKTQHRRIMDSFAKRLKTSRKTIREFEQAQEDSVKILYKANMKIKELEEELALWQTPPEKKTKEGQNTKSPNPSQGKTQKFIDLPDGSNRNSP